MYSHVICMRFILHILSIISTCVIISLLCIVCMPFTLFMILNSMFINVNAILPSYIKIHKSHLHASLNMSATLLH